MRHIETPPLVSTCNNLVKLGIESQAVIAARCAIVAEGGFRRHLNGAAEGRIVEHGQILGRGAGEAYRRKEGCVAVARKLAIIMHRMWLDGIDFQFG